MYTLKLINNEAYNLFIYLNIWPTVLGGYKTIHAPQWDRVKFNQSKLSVI